MGKFQFKQFAVTDSHTAMKIGTDGVLLGAWTSIASSPATIIDAGCGCGLIALMMAQRTSASDNIPNIIGVEIDAGAAADAADNAKASKWADRITIANSDIFDFDIAAQASRPLLIVSNPPFFKEKLQSPDRARALARHGGEFDVIELIKWSAGVISSPADRLSFIAPAERDGEIDYALSLARLYPLEKCAVYSRQGGKPMRTLWLASSAPYTLKRTEIIIRNADNTLTDNYKNLTQSFYLDK